MADYGWLTAVVIDLAVEPASQLRNRFVQK